MFKEVTVQEDGKVMMVSTNTAYHPYTVEACEVLEIWQCYKYQTATLPEPPTDLDQVKRLIEKLTVK